jgi:hypothetical protein
MDTRKVDLDEIADTLLPEVNELSPGELDELLDTESDALTRHYFEVLAKDIRRSRRPQYHESDCAPTIDVVPKTIRALTEYVQSQMFVHFRNGSAHTWNEYAWSGTHVPARVMRQAGEAGAGPQHRAHLLNGIFDILEETTRSYLGVSDAYLDDLWPLLECLEQLGREVSSEPLLSSVYVRRYVALATAADSPALACGLTWGVNELLERGRACQRLASQLAAELVRADPTDQVRCVIALLMHVRPRDRRRLPETEIRMMDKSGRDFMWSLLAHVQRTSELLSISFRVDRPGRISFGDALPREFFQLLYLARHGSALPAICAMAAIKLSLRGIYSPLEGGQVRTRSAAISYICALLLDRVAGREAGNGFSACEALEGLRDRFKGECADAMAELVATARPLVRQGIFVFIAEGYEVSFCGRRQTAVPHFVESRGRIRFVSTGHENDLNSFGRKVARFATRDPDLRQHIEWMNQRLEGWLLHSAA